MWTLCRLHASLQEVSGSTRTKLNATDCLQLLVERPHCRWQYGYYLLLVVPLIPFGIALVLSLLAWVWLHKVKRPKLMGVRLGFMCVHKEHFEHYFVSCAGLATQSDASM